jgi:hypothetical protein
MDAVWYLRHRRDGGTDGVWRWETAQAVTTWEQASAPGQLGRKVLRTVIRRQPPDAWARPTTNLLHWATGAGWGLQYAAVAGRRAGRSWWPALALGPAAWLSSYVVLPVAKVYRPIWEYDARTLGRDLSAHVVYGLTTSGVYAALDRARAPRGRGTHRPRARRAVLPDRAAAPRRHR